MATAMKAFAVTRPAMVQRPSVANSRQSARIVVRGAPEKSQIDAAVKEAQEACAGGDAGECATAWDTVEELNAAASHAKETTTTDPLELYCEGAPDADECRVYED